MFAVIFICRKLFLRIAGKSKKLENAKISCQTVFFRRLFNKRLKKKIPFGTLKLLDPR